MKKAISIVLQTILLLLANDIGFFMHPFQLKQIISRTTTMPIGHGPWLRLSSQTGIQRWDGLLFMLAVYVLILVIEAYYKRLPAGILGSTVALMLATILSSWIEFGYRTTIIFP